jgi:hypothetical protein
MSQTFNFEELDDATREYLIAVREAEGKRMPGMFAPTTSSLAGLGCLAGLVLVPLTLVMTLTNAIDVVYDDPIKVAFLQTAGLLLGGWLILSYFRGKGKKRDPRTAGHWVYMDANHLYVAYREQVTITRVDDVSEAIYTHNYHNGTYQNSVVKIILGDRKTTSFTLNKEANAEKFVTFVNYLAWAHGSDGSEAAKLSPAKLGGVAKYVARHDVEPKDADGALDTDLVELDIDEIPDEPKREGRSSPSFLPYIVMIVAAIVIFVIMGFVVNPPIRDQAIYSAVMTRPTEPSLLRAYLMDNRNVEYRDEVLKELSSHYLGVINHIDRKAQQPELKFGMLKILDSLKNEPGDPAVSIRVTERSVGKPLDGADARANKLRDDLVGGKTTVSSTYGILDLFARVSPAISIPGVTIFPPPTPIGKQLIAFVEPPAEAKNAHIGIIYEFTPTERDNNYLLTVTVEIREKVDGEPIATYTTPLTTYSGDEASLNQAIDALRVNLLRGMVGEPDGLRLQ